MAMHISRFIPFSIPFRFPFRVLVTPVAWLHVYIQSEQNEYTIIL